jgi:hypothetical protein
MFPRDGRRSPYAVLVPFAAVALVSTTKLAWLVREQLRQNSIVLAQQSAVALGRMRARELRPDRVGVVSQRQQPPQPLPDGLRVP